MKWLIIGAGAGLSFALVLYFFSDAEEKIKDEFEAKLGDAHKTHAAQIANLFEHQTQNGDSLLNAYSEVEKYKRLLANQEDENALLVNKIKGKDAVIMRLNRKIKRLL